MSGRLGKRLMRSGIERGTGRVFGERQSKARCGECHTCREDCSPENVVVFLQRQKCVLGTVDGWLIVDVPKLGGRGEEHGNSQGARGAVHF